MYTLFVLVHPRQRRRMTDVRDISNRDGYAESQLEGCTACRPDDDRNIYRLWPAGRAVAAATATAVARVSTQSFEPNDL